MNNFGDVYTQLKTLNSSNNWNLEIEFKVQGEWHLACTKEDNKDNVGEFKKNCFCILQTIEEYFENFFVTDWHLNYNVCTFNIKQK